MVPMDAASSGSAIPRWTLPITKLSAIAQSAAAIAVSFRTCDPARGTVTILHHRIRIGCGTPSSSRPTSPPGSPSCASGGRLILHPFIGKKTTLMKDVQQGKTRHNDHRREPNHHNTAVSEPVGDAAAANVRLSGSTYGHCATPQLTMTLATATMASTRAPR